MCDLCDPEIQHRGQSLVATLFHHLEILNKCELFIFILHQVPSNVASPGVYKQGDDMSLFARHSHGTLLSPGVTPWCSFSIPRNLIHEIHTLSPTKLSY